MGYLQYSNTPLKIWFSFSMNDFITSTLIFSSPIRKTSIIAHFLGHKYLKRGITNAITTIKCE